MASDTLDSEEHLVSTSLEITQTYHMIDDVFHTRNKQLADLYIPWKRSLIIVDFAVYELYGAHIKNYFETYDITITIYPTHITEDRKNIETLLEVCGWITEFNLLRREPVLAIGGGLVTDVVGFACAIYRRATQYIRIPTTLVGLIDASVSNRVAVNWRGLKNRLGSYHEPLHTFVDCRFLRTVPEAEIRNGIAEILKISSCTQISTFETLEQYGQSFITQRFGQFNSQDRELARTGEVVIRQAIRAVLEVEVPNSREQSLDRAMYFGHTWSPTLELAVSPHLLHGHAVSVDMCFSATLAHHLGLLPFDQYHRFLMVFSKLGLALDHPVFTLDLMKEATNATIATRDGKLRAPVPIGILGSYKILQTVDDSTLDSVHEKHKRMVGEWPREGLGVDMDIAVRSRATENGLLV